MYIFVSATKTITTYSNSYFWTIPPVKEIYCPLKIYYFFIFVFSKTISNKSLKKSYSFRFIPQVIQKKFKFKLAAGKNDPTPGFTGLKKCIASTISKF